MKTLAIAGLLIFACLALDAQPNTIRVKAGDNMLDVLGKEIYFYPDFQQGIIRYKPGKLQSSSFNFNMLNGEVQFLTAKGDTLSLADEKTIDYVAIGTDTFRYDNGYLRQLHTNGTIRLAIRTQIKILDVQKIGAYDQPSSTGAVASYDSYSTGVRSFKLNIREDVLLAKQSHYFLGDRFNRFELARKRMVFNLYPKKHAALSQYFRENNIDFDNEADLRKLLDFLTQL